MQAPAEDTCALVKCRGKLVCKVWYPTIPVFLNSFIYLLVWVEVPTAFLVGINRVSVKWYRRIKLARHGVEWPIYMIMHTWPTYIPLLDRSPCTLSGQGIVVCGQPTFLH